MRKQEVAKRADYWALPLILSLQQTQEEEDKEPESWKGPGAVVNLSLLGLLQRPQAADQPEGPAYGPAPPAQHPLSVSSSEEVKLAKKIGQRNNFTITVLQFGSICALT